MRAGQGQVSLVHCYQKYNLKSFHVYLTEVSHEITLCGPGTSLGLSILLMIVGLSLPLEVSHY